MLGDRVGLVKAQPLVCVCVSHHTHHHRRDTRHLKMLNSTPCYLTALGAWVAQYISAFVFVIKKLFKACS